MVRLSVELIRKKAEHHDGLLEDLEEISLHQLNIEKIETISRLCPRLKILYLQNNLIPKIENIKRLKSLIYLNLALNNLTSISPEVSSLEKLQKLDLTVNFIDVDQLEPSITNLRPLIHLTELYLTGNPVTTFDGYRLYVLHRLPGLKKLDGQEVTKAERIQAKQAFEQIAERLRVEAEKKRREEGEAESSKEKSTDGKDDDDRAEAEKSSSSSSSSTFNNEAAPYTPETRLAMHREQEEAERKKEEDRKRAMRDSDKDDLWKEAQEKMNQKVVATDGDELPKQRNMGKWDFTLKEDALRQCVVLDVSIQRFLDTSLIDIDLHPTWIQILIKGKNLLLHLPAEVRPSEARVQRIQHTGHLVVTAPKVKKVEQMMTTNQLATQKKSSTGNGMDDDDEDEEEKEASAAVSNLKVSSHNDVLDLSSSSSSSKSRSPASGSTSTSSSNSSCTDDTAPRHTRSSGSTLNQVVADYRHIIRKKPSTTPADASSSTGAGAQMTELSVTRSATLEEARRRRQEEESRLKEEERHARKEAEKAELERLGLDDTGVPDLE